MTISNPQSEIRNLPATARPCRACRCPMLLAPSVESGKQLPLDRRAPVYLVYRAADGSEKAWDVNSLLATAGEMYLRTADGLKKMDVIGVHVSHFATCPAAGSFSKKS